MMYKNIGIYIHIPFCAAKCPYCDFYSIKYNNKSNLQKRYFVSLSEEIKSYKDNVKKSKRLVDTIYFGGGTPSIVDVGYIDSTLKSIKSIFKCKNLETTLEANPNTLDNKYLKSIKKVGVNRLSLGLQSANDDELYILGRMHTVNDVKISIQSAQKIGINNISVDLILGLPDQTIAKVENSLKFIETLNVQHVSAYILQIEKNTIFNNPCTIERLPNEEMVADIYLLVVNRLNNMGFNQYEISNFAKPGFESKHNLKYWNREEYIGFGSSAHSYYNNKRYNIENNIYKYIGMGDNKKFIYNYDSVDNEINEYIMLKLRTSSGININDMKKIYPTILVNEFLDNIKKCYNSKYIDFSVDNIKLTTEGFLIYNTIISDLMID